MVTATKKMRTAIPLIALMLVSMTAAPLVAAALVLTTNKTIYNPGDTLIVSGTATPNSAVTIKVYNPSNSLVAIGQGNTGPSGQYTLSVFTWPLNPTLAIPFGLYGVTVTDGTTGEFSDTTVEYTQLVSPGPGGGVVKGVLVQITVSTSPSYQLGDTVRVFAAFAYNGTKVDPTSTVVLVYPPGITPIATVLQKAGIGLYYFDYTPTSVGTYAVQIEAAARQSTNLQLTTFQVTERLATANDLSEMENALSAKIDTSQQAIVDRITSAQRTINGAVSSTQSSLNNAITNAQNDVKTSVSNAQSSIDDKISSTESALNGSIDSAKNDVNGKIDSAASDIKSSISSNADSIKSQITSSEQAIKDAIDGIQGAVNSVVQPVIGQITQLTQTVNSLESNLSLTEEGVSAVTTWIMVVGIIAAITLVLELVILIRKLS